MPLHAKDEAVLGAFDTFDDTVSGDGVDDEPAAELLNGLMMGCVDPQVLPAEDFEKPRAGFNPNRVVESVWLSAALVGAGAGKLGRNVLVKRSAQSDINRLGAAADAQYRKITTERRCGHLELEFGARGFDFAELFDRPFAVIARMNIEMTAAQHQTIQAGYHMTQGGFYLRSRHYNRNGPGPRNRRQITLWQEQCGIFRPFRPVGRSARSAGDIRRDTDQRRSTAGHSYCSYKRL